MSLHATAPAEIATHYAPPVAGLARLQRAGLALALLGGVGCVVGAMTAPEQFYRSYLPGWLFWMQVALGGLGLAMLNQLTHGGWGLLVRRVFESAASTLPAMLVLFVPVLFGLGSLYEWTHADVVASEPVLQAKAAYLNVPFFMVRAGLYFAVWIVLAVLARRWSLEQDRTGEPRLHHRMRTLSAAGLILFVLTASFAAFDWMMSVDPHWFSSIYGVQFVGGAAVAGLAFAIVVSCWLETQEPMSRVFTPKNHQDHGTLLFAFLLLWGYFIVSQFIIIWSANLPEEISFYLERQTDGWKVFSVVLVLLHFVIPFLLLLSPAIKRNPRAITAIALTLLLMRWVDLHFQMRPHFVDHVAVHWLDFASLIGVGGVWLALFARSLSGPSLLPVHDPFLPEALGHE